MVRFTGGLLLFTAFAAAVPADLDRPPGQTQQVLQSESQVVQPPGNPRKLKGKFLHITDLHPDPFYKKGATPDGDHPCHQGKGEQESGHYGAPITDCDSPFTLVNATFDWIAKHIKDEIDFVIWTGDSARHDNDENFPRTSVQILELNRYAVQKVVETFGKTDKLHDPDPTNDLVVPVVPTYGNNDILPHNIFMPGPNPWTRGYEDVWKNFIPEQQKHSFARGGWFWTEVIPNRLAVISLNTLYFFERNSAVDGCDLRSEPGYEHMEWLRIQLQFMRERGVKAILIGHVPPARTESKQNWDESCYQKYVLWQRQYRDVILANIFGHMNIDHFMFHDVRDLTYKFPIPGIDSSELTGNDDLHSRDGGDFNIQKKTTYLTELRDAWNILPMPPKGVRYGSTSDLEESTKKKKKKHRKDKKGKKQRRKSKKKFLDEIGGQYGERFSMSIVSPSVVPNFFPSLRIIEYNITGMKHEHPSAGPPQGYSATEEDLHYHLDLQERDGDDYIETYNHDEVETEKKKKKKKKKNKHEGKHGKKPVQKPDFPIPAPPSKASPPGPAYSPQTLSLISWTQLYANLTSIHEQMFDDKLLAPAHEVESGSKDNDKYFGYQLEYNTHEDPIYKMPDLTVRNWLDLAERIGRTRYMKPHRNASLNATQVSINHSLDGTEDSYDEGFDDPQIEPTKKHKKKHKKKKSFGKLKDNELWHEFVRRAFVHAKSDEDLTDDFG